MEISPTRKLHDGIAYTGNRTAHTGNRVPDRSRKDQPGATTTQTGKVPECGNNAAPESAGIAEGALEAARLTAMRSSDATVAIDACLRVMDAEQLEAALPSLIHLLSRGTGLPTRAGRSLGRLEHDAPRQRMQMLTTACKCSLRRRIRSPRRPFSAHLGALFAHHGAPLRRHRSDSGAARTDAATAAAPARGPPAAHIARGLAI